MIKKSEQEIKKWFNTSGLRYKELNLKEKLDTMNDKEKIELLASDGMLIKRPILVSDKGIFTGFKENMNKTLDFFIDIIEKENLRKERCFYVAHVKNRRSFKEITDKHKNGTSR